MQHRSCFNLASLVFAVTVSLVSLQAQAQPSSIGPQDIARLKQLTEFTNEWFYTNLYDLEHPVELFVTIQGVNIPDTGYAELLFTVDSTGRGVDEATFDPDHVFVAILQLAETAKRLGANANSFSRGVQARVLGWPATSENISTSILGFLGPNRRKGAVG